MLHADTVAVLHAADLMRGPTTPDSWRLGRLCASHLLTTPATTEAEAFTNAKLPEEIRDAIFGAVSDEAAFDLDHMIQQLTSPNGATQTALAVLDGEHVLCTIPVQRDGTTKRARFVTAEADLMARYYLSDGDKRAASAVASAVRRHDLAGNRNAAIAAGRAAALGLLREKINAEIPASTS